MTDQQQMMEKSMNTGMKQEDREAIAKLLNKALADEFMLYTKTLNYHWNITGPQFVSVHELLDKHYNELQGVMDEVAERIRMIGAKAAGTMAEFQELTELKEHKGKLLEADEMVTDLIADHERVIASLREVLEVAGDKHSDKGTEDLLTGVMQQHEKMAWMLRSLQEGRSVKQ